MGLLKALFGRQSKSKTSESSILSTILRIENQNSLDNGKTVILEGCSALLLNTTDHPFFEDIDSSLENSAKNLVILNSIRSFQQLLDSLQKYFQRQNG